MSDGNSRRILWPNGTVSETVELGTSSNGREVTDDELDNWIVGFPLEDLWDPWDSGWRARHRFVLQPAGLRTPDLKHSTCRRILWPNGTVSETVELGTSSNGREVTDDELDNWIAGFPPEAL